jgi:GH25 family lysozyme M1 (1,4-beta-N-acetylmuramidase)
MTVSHRASLDDAGKPLAAQIRPARVRSAAAILVVVLVANTIKSYFVDLSHWSGPVDWDLVAQYVLAFIFKATEGLDFFDNQFAANKAGAIRTGRAWAAYHFYRVVDPIKQARHFVDVVGAGCNKYIVDVELDYVHDADVLLAFLQEIERLTGKKPVIYSSKYYWSFVRPTPAWIGDYEFWVANYFTLYPAAPAGANVVAQQYEVRGVIPGVQEMADENFFYGSLLEMWAWFGNGGTQPPQPFNMFLPIVSRGG